MPQSKKHGRDDYHYRPTGPTKELLKLSGFHRSPRSLLSTVRSSFMTRYEVQKLGGDHHTEWWVPAAEVEELNDNIVGFIEVIGEYRSQT